MSLTAGTRLGAYEIIASLGAGGMGEVTRKFNLHPDGKRVIVASPDTTGVTAHDKVVFVMNFFDELERLLPPGR